MVHWLGIHNLTDGAVGVTVMRIAEGKLALTPLKAFICSIL